MKEAIELVINGEVYDLIVTPNLTLLEAIRDRIGLWGTKSGCEMGTCGSCTVLVEGKPVLACLMLAIDCNGIEITTIEGLSEGSDLSILQDAFVRYGAVQCGFCTPGLIMSGTALLKKNPDPEIDEIKKALEGNLCRCTGYNSIIDAVLDAASLQKTARGQRGNNE
ncbi:MAG: (2Fe-2S)-binding protein [Proteobacteria bacterium]|nr:(2Fe-2S)-binding protein [Pseudomonadota bacterium]